MYTVPFAFCNLVCSLLRKVAPLEKINKGRWKEAAGINLNDSRVFVDVSFNFNRNSWSYIIENKIPLRNKKLSFKDLKKLDRRHLHVRNVKFLDRLRGGTESSLEEINEIAKFTAAFVNLGAFVFRPTKSCNVQGLAELIRFYKTASFERLSFGALSFTSCSVLMTEFLQHQLQSVLVSNLIISDRDGVSFPRPIVEEFLLKVQFNTAVINCEKAPFDLNFFEQLLDWPFPTRYASTVLISCTCGVDKFRALCPDQQLPPSNSRNIAWRRADGGTAAVDVYDQKVSQTDELETGKMDEAKNELKDKQKLGHRRIGEEGEVSYKWVPSSDLMAAIQLGISNSVGSLASKPERQIIIQDFADSESVSFPSEGSQTTPSHKFRDFRFVAHAAMAFRHFRARFGIKPADFLRSICTEPLRELSNPGASGSIFYVSADERFIIKTVQKKESEFLHRLLPGYFRNVEQNQHTLLPKFCGFFSYKSFGRNIRLIVMNNLFPQSMTIHEKYDLKGSTFKRRASKAETQKRSPTLKDLDFRRNHKDGFTLDPAIHDALMKVLNKDTLVLRSFRIMDHSLLMGVHNINLANDVESSSSEQPSTSRDVLQNHKGSQKKKTKVTFNPAEGIPARNSKDEQVLLFIGIIDILQSYGVSKRIEHLWKSVLHDGDTVSVHEPGFYAERFQKFMQMEVFRNVQSETTQTKHEGKSRSAKTALQTEEKKVHHKHS